LVYNQFPKNPYMGQFYLASSKFSGDSLFAETWVLMDHQIWYPN